MRYRVMPAVVLLVGLMVVLSARGEDKDTKSLNLFNGKDLTGWKFIVNTKRDSKGDAKETWTVKEKVLICKGEPWGYLITDKEYGDYKLELEWRWADTDKTSKIRRNSGVLLHAKGETEPWPNSFEAQLLSGGAGDIYLMGSKVEGERKDSKNANRFPRAKTDKPIEKELGEWNKYEITCKGDTVELVVNGQKVNTGKNAERSKGRIALQSEGAEIHFRNIKLTPLK
jgi:hypothetical protein